MSALKTFDTVGVIEYKRKPQDRQDMIALLCETFRSLIGLLHALTAPTGADRSPMEDAWIKMTLGLTTRNKQLEQALVQKEQQIGAIRVEQERREAELLRQIKMLGSSKDNLTGLFTALARAQAKGPAWASDQEFLGDLIKLCHPDRHAGDKNLEIANKVTGTLLLTLKELKAPKKPETRIPAPRTKAASPKKRTPR